MDKSILVPDDTSAAGHAANLIPEGDTKPYAHVFNNKYYMIYSGKVKEDCADSRIVFVFQNPIDP
ncbi:hypothetical protein PAT3040_00855 [Paenibacillus agaridevorans]|uniref:Uncharacterized protein n=1 Tax=Paenibacillus agaridevorans TaxID=171404 RepID=A0A2R5EIA9_9BACL|nr:hypothetical protein PAT3040_00855 [Paenibacillus agaridevorans]